MDPGERNRLRRAQALDRDALVDIYDEYHPLIYRYVYRRLGHVDAARDVTSGVFQRLLAAFHDGNGPDASVRAWLYRAAHNAVVDYYRRQQHRQHLPIDEGLIDGESNPGKDAEQRILAGEVRRALDELTPDQQQVIALKFLEGLSNKEVSAVLGKTEGAVKSLQHRGLAALRRRLMPEPCSRPAQESAAEEMVR